VGSTMSENGAVGIFWWIDGTLLAAGCAVSEAEAYGDNLTYDGGHAEHWDRWRAAGASWLKAHDMPLVICTSEYDEHPRGRIVKRPEGFVVYADRRLHGRAIMSAICLHFDLESSAVVVQSDPHYR
jgi:hypothetical protein